MAFAPLLAYHYEVVASSLRLRLRHQLRRDIRRYFPVVVELDPYLCGSEINPAVSRQLPEHAQSRDRS
jgi:hypothetical protein